MMTNLPRFPPRVTRALRREHLSINMVSYLQAAVLPARVLLEAATAFIICASLVPPTNLGNITSVLQVSALWATADTPMLIVGQIEIIPSSMHVRCEARFHSLVFIKITVYIITLTQAYMNYRSYLDGSQS